MKKFNKNSTLAVLAVSCAIMMFGFILPVQTFAATSPSLGAAATFGILSSTFSPIIASTGITGDLGYTTLSSPLFFTVSGSTYIGGGAGDATYQQAGIDQLSALNNVTNGLNTQTCTDISSLTPAALNGVDIDGAGAIVAGHFIPGCYYSTGAMGIVASTNIYLDGAGTYIFKSTGGALTTGADSQVILNGASACDIFWAPVAATSLGANSVFKGTVIDAAGISVGDTVDWTGRALAFGGTVNANHDTIAVPVCASAPATLNVAKTVVNSGIGTSTASAFSLSLKLSGSEVGGGPFAGVALPGRAYTGLSAGTYVVSETANSFYTPSFSASCPGGSIALVANNNLTCTITNTYNPVTLHVIKLVVNTTAGRGMAIASNFNVHVKTAAGVEVSGSPQAGTTGLGTLYTIPADTYVISEDAYPLYTQSFSGTCPGGRISLTPGSDGICTIINTDVPPPPVGVTGSGTGGVQIVPIIGIEKVPSPLALPLGSGAVTYNYRVWNVAGQQALTSVTVKDDKCSPVTLLSGDINGNGKLDPSENWKYSCSTTLATTTTNTAIATGYGDNPDHQVAIATALATVVVGVQPSLPPAVVASLTPPLIAIVKVPSRLTPFPFGGGNVTYTYTVTNPGVVPMSNVLVADDKCSAVSRVSGDVNGNNLLEPGESWTYICSSNISVSTRNVATALGKANGFTALSYAFATVLVSAPGLPNTGLPPKEASASLSIVILSIIFGGSLILYVIQKKRIV